MGTILGRERLDRDWLSVYAGLLSRNRAVFLDVLRLVFVLGHIASHLCARVRMGALGCRALSKTNRKRICFVRRLDGFPGVPLCVSSGPDWIWTDDAGRTYTSLLR